MDFTRLSEFVGKLFVIISFGFLIFILSSLDFSSITQMFRVSWIPIIMILAGIFSLLYFFMASAWRGLLALSSERSLDKQVLSVYLKTVIYKYAPGNIFHFVGRHSLSESHDLNHKTIAFANGVEILMQLFAVSLIIMIGSIFFDFSLDVGSYFALSQSKLILAFSLLLLLSLIVLLKKKYRDILLQKSSLKVLSMVLLKHLIFLFGSAFLLVGVYFFILDVDFTGDILVQTILVSSIAWLLGFIVPGAPGGVGIRESILLLLLPTIMILPQSQVLAGALIYRVVTILGEGLTYFWAKLLKNNTRK